MTKNKKVLLVMLGLGILFSLGLGSCKKYADPAPYFEDYGKPPVTVRRKVLMLSMDGAIGQAVKTISPPTIMGMLANSKYSWNGITETPSTDAATWESMMTGVPFSAHLIQDSTFIFNPGPFGDEGATAPYYPPFFQYVFSGLPSAKIGTVTSWSRLSNALFTSAQKSLLAADDKGVKDSVINLLKDAKSDLIVANFNSVNLAGIQSGFSAGNTQYKNAVLTVDGYIKEIMGALKARPGYDSSENWLVIITSNHGGINNGFGGGSAGETNNFVVYYNKYLKSQEVLNQGFNGVKMGGKITAAINNKTGLFDVGASQDFSVQVQAKFNATNSYPGFIGKSTPLSGSTLTGWYLMQEGDHYNLEFGGSANGGTGKTQFGVPGTITDGKWHTLTFTVKMSGGVRTATAYTDGKKITSGNITNCKSLNTTVPFSIGNIDGSSTTSDYYPAGVQYFNVALDDATILNNINLQDITKHPNYANLIGYWTCNDGYGSYYKNTITTYPNTDFTLTGAYAWTSLSDVPSFLTPPPAGSLSILPKDVDIPSQVLYWLNVPIQQNWGLSGSSWLSNFEIEFIK